MTMHHSEKRVLNFLRRHQSTILFWIGFGVFFTFINTASNAIYDKYLSTKVTGSSEVANVSDALASTSTASSTCNILGINLHGAIYTYLPETSKDDLLSNKDVIASEKITSLIQTANSDDQIKGIIVEIDSPGGEPVAGEEVAKALKASEKPTVAVIRQSGLSAAYWAASGADRIFASRNSDVGSIGVTASYLENVNKDKRFVQLSAGKFKDSGNPDKPLTEEEKALALRDIKIVYENFIEDIAANRNLKVDAVRKIADGSSVLGATAKSLGLVDEIGGLPEAEKYLGEKIDAKADVCW